MPDRPDSMAGTPSPRAGGAKGDRADDDPISSFDLAADDDRWLDHVRSAEAPTSLGSIGEYEILAEVSRGGQGIVYHARQPGTNRDIAVKRMRAGSFATPASRRRFDREVETAAALNHPNIVTAYGIDVVDGEPVFAMEWIEGESVTAWASSVRGKEGGTRRMARMMGGIAEAVQHAHMRGVIHRDLKPSNILVGADDQPHVLDFGLAKSETIGGAPVTLTEQFLGTPAYASPEHIRGGGAGVDTRSDVYSLGVILYEMLSGSLPYAVDGDLPDVLHNVEHASPKKLSMTGANVPRELELIVLKALSKDRDQRYQSAQALADDLLRFVRGESVEAHPPSTMYQLRTIVRRYRAIVSLACLLAIALLAGVVVAGVQAVTIARERDRVAAQSLLVTEQRDRARFEAERAQAVSDFLIAMVAAPDPRADGRDVRVLDVLASADASLETSFADQPALRLELHLTLSDVYKNLGDLEAAERHTDSAAAIVAEHFPDDGERQSAVADARAGLLVSAGEWKRAEAVYREALAGAPLPTPGNRAGFGLWNGLAGNLVDQRNYDEAERILRALLEACDGTQPGDDTQRLTLLNNLAQLLREAGKMREAESIFREVLADQRKHLRPDHADLLTTMTNLGDLLCMLNETDEGIAMLQAAHVGRARALGEDHPDTIEALNNLALAYQNKGDLKKAQPHFERGLEVNRAALGPTHPNTLSAMNNLAFNYKKQNRLEEALPLWEEVTRVTRETLGPEHPFCLSAMSNQVGVLCMLDRAEDAVPVAEEAVRGARKTMPEGHWMIGAFENALGFALLDLKRYEEAEGPLTRGYEILLAAYGEHHPSVATSRSNLQRLYAGWGRPIPGELGIEPGTD